MSASYGLSRALPCISGMIDSSCSTYTSSCTRVSGVRVGGVEVGGGTSGWVWNVDVRFCFTFIVLTSTIGYLYLFS